MMLAAATVPMIGGWAGREERADARRSASDRASAIAATASVRRAANRRLALGFLAFAACILALTFGVALAYRYSGIGATLSRQ